MRMMIWLLLLPHLIFGQTMSVPKYSIVEIPTHSRALAMGGTGIANSMGNQQLTGNLGKTVFTPHFHQASVTYQPWLRSFFSDSKFMRVDYLKTVGASTTLGFAIDYLDLGNLTLRDNNGASLSIHPNYQFGVGSSVGIRLNDQAGIGVGLHWLSARQFDRGFPTNAHTMTGNLHYYQFASLRNPSQQIQWGIVVNQLTASRHAISTAGLGIAYQWQSENEDMWTFEMDMKRLIFQTKAPLQFSLGSEYVFSAQFFLRGGFGWESLRSGGRKMITMGAGYKGFVADQSFSLDVHYAVPIGMFTVSPLQHSYGLSLGINMGHFQ